MASAGLRKNQYPVTGAPYKVKGEEVIGIPEKGLIQPIRSIRKRETWELAVHSHKAKRAGHHFDLRLGDPSTGHGHSWALRHWPKPGERRLATQQSTHSIPYFDWTGTIEEGYGAGKVDLAMREKTQITSAGTKKVNFNVRKGKSIEQYTLIRTKGKKWLLLNRTNAGKKK